MEYSSTVKKIKLFFVVSIVVINIQAVSSRFQTKQIQSVLPQTSTTFNQISNYPHLAIISQLIPLQQALQSCSKNNSKNNAIEYIQKYCAQNIGSGLCKVNWNAITKMPDACAYIEKIIRTFLTEVYGTDQPFYNQNILEPLVEQLGNYLEHMQTTSNRSFDFTQLATSLTALGDADEFYTWLAQVHVALLTEEKKEIPDFKQNNTIIFTSALLQDALNELAEQTKQRIDRIRVELQKITKEQKKVELEQWDELDFTNVEQPKLVSGGQKTLLIEKQQKLNKEINVAADKIKQDTDLKEKLAASRIKEEQAKQNLEKQIAELQATMPKLEEVNSLKEATKTIQNKITEITNRHTILLENLTKSKAEKIANLEGSYNRMRNEIESSLQAKSGIIATGFRFFGYTSDEVKELSTRLKNLASDLEFDKNNINQEIEKRHTTVQKLYDQQLEELNQKNREIKQNIEDANKEYDDKQRTIDFQIAQKNKEITASNQRIAALVKQEQESNTASLITKQKELKQKLIAMYPQLQQFVKKESIETLKGIYRQSNLFNLLIKQQLDQIFARNYTEILGYVETIVANVIGTKNWVSRFLGFQPNMSLDTKKQIIKTIEQKAKEYQPSQLSLTERAYAATQNFFAPIIAKLKAFRDYYSGTIKK